MVVEVHSGQLTKSTKKAAGWDIHAVQDEILLAGESKRVKTGIVTTMLDCFALIVDKSGLAGNYRVTTRGGLIDADYNKEWEVILVNESTSNINIQKGQKIAQVIFFANQPVIVCGREVKVLVQDRGGGFGSTGI